MDSLGGILTKGLLGNPILARFSLGGWIEIEVVDPGGGGGGKKRGGRGIGGGLGGFKPHIPHREEEKKYIVITTRLRGEVKRSRFEVSDFTANLSINILKVMQRTSESLLRIKRVFIRESKQVPIKPVVRIRDDRD